MFLAIQLGRVVPIKFLYGLARAEILSFIPFHANNFFVRAGPDSRRTFKFYTRPINLLYGSSRIPGVGISVSYSFVLSVGKATKESFKFRFKNRQYYLQIYPKADNKLLYGSSRIPGVEISVPYSFDYP